MVVPMIVFIRDPRWLSAIGTTIGIPMTSIIGDDGAKLSLASPQLS